MLWMYKNKAKVKRMVEKSYKWVGNNLTWNKHIVPQWIKLIDSALEQPEQTKAKTKAKISARTKDYIEYV